MQKEFKNYKKNSKGYTLVELLVVVFIFSLITISLSRFTSDIFTLNFFLQGSLNAQIDMRHIVKVMVTDIREAGPSALGAYPIALASTSAMTFYTDADNDGVRDQVRYFISNGSLKRGVTAPSGSPLTYNIANEKLVTLASDIVSSSTLPLFQYYPSSYSGTTSPLSIPVDVPSVRLVKITVIIDKDPNRSPSTIITSSQVNIRNLKDNL